MPSQGPLSGGTFSSVTATGNAAWTNPGNAAASDNNAATANIRTNWTTQILKATNFGFSIPAEATITGVVVEVERSNNDDVGTDFIDGLVQLYKADALTGTGKAPGTPIPQTDTYASFGGSSDMWGATLTPAEVNDSGFGVGYRIDGALGTNTGTHFQAVDHIRITVHYTEPAGVALAMHHYRMRRAR